MRVIDCCCAEPANVLALHCALSQHVLSSVLGVSCMVIGLVGIVASSLALVLRAGAVCDDRNDQVFTFV